MRFPKIIHLIYIPWNRKQKLKKDYMDFDRSFYYNFKKQVGNKWEVKLWTWDIINIFMNKYYMDEWKLIQKHSSRPTMLVDYLRWKLVYHYGGIYWQYGSKLKNSIEILIPKHERCIKLVTESYLNLFCRYWNSLYKIRNGIPEEEIRICNQVFAAYPKNKFVRKVIKSIVINIQKYKVTEDYDILYICANALVSKIYDRYDKKCVERLTLKEANSIISIHGKGSWRTDKKWLF